MDIQFEQHDVLDEYVCNLRALDLKFERLATLHRLAAEDLLRLRQRTADTRRLLWERGGAGH